MICDDVVFRSVSYITLPSSAVLFAYCMQSRCVYIKSIGTRARHKNMPVPPADGFMRGTMTGALWCSLGLVREELGEEEEEEEEGTLDDSLSPLLMARAEGLALLSRLWGFGTEFSRGRRENEEMRPKKKHKVVGGLY